MNFKNTIASTALIISGLLSLSLAQAEVVWDLSAPSGLLGTTQTYTTGGVTITAAGFAGVALEARPTGSGRPLAATKGGLGLLRIRLTRRERNQRPNFVRDRYDGSANGSACQASRSMMDSTTNARRPGRVFGSNSATLRLCAGRQPATDELEHFLSGANANLAFYDVLRCYR